MSLFPGMPLWTPAAAGNPSLISAITTAGLTSNLKLCLDAGDSSSYTSGQSWLDTSGNGYDFFLGTTSGSEATDPTFNGSAGGLSSSEYFSSDGGDCFRYDGTNETWMENLHKNNAIFTILGAVYPLNSTFLFGTSAANNGIQFNAATGATYQVRNAGSNALLVTGDTSISTSAWHIMGVSLNEATGSGGGFLYLDGAYNQVSASNTFNSAYSSPSSSAATYTAEIGARGNAVNVMPSGSRIGWLAIWEGTALSKANMDTLYAALKGRYGLS